MNIYIYFTLYIYFTIYRYLSQTQQLVPSGEFKHNWGTAEKLYKSEVSRGFGLSWA